jgi:hypothetical protein
MRARGTLPAVSFVKPDGLIVDRCAALLKEMNATYRAWPDGGTVGSRILLCSYLEDPDGIRLEVNFVPGAGLLAEGAQFNPVPATSNRLLRSPPPANEGNS